MEVEEAGGEEESGEKEKRAGREQSRMEPAEEVVEMEVFTKAGKAERVRVNGGLSLEDRARMRECIQKKVDVFAWSAADMSGIDADVACHRLNLDPKTHPIRQKMRIIATKLEEPIRKEIKKLLDAGFISEIQYPGWVSNVVMVKKGDVRWRMCVDFSLLNKSCLNDCYPCLGSTRWLIQPSTFLL
ncbi:hypothetical protein KSP39_PZI018475 [Platanthera zijinensis]|uniref:Reverse transcriptase domain-containing protein n=1 Tax=Platanthera zijinensis TaxID=2320716 RepID=A0AAP0B3H1_9ASPA